MTYRLLACMILLGLAGAAFSGCNKDGETIVLNGGTVGPLPSGGGSALALSPATLPDATQGVAYVQSVTISGGSGNYQFAITSGSLPAGLTFAGTSQSASISGTPTTPGTSSFVLQVVQNGQTVFEETLSLRVNTSGLALITTSLALGVTSTAYTQGLSATGGTGAGYTWSVTSGSLPAGLTLTDGTPTATLSGTPAAVGTSTFTVQVQDSGNNTASQTFVVGVEALLSITTASLPRGLNGSAYNQSVTASGGTGVSYVWSLTSGTLPSNVTLAQGTPSATLSGTPAAVGTSTFTLSVSDARQTASRTYSVVIDPVLDITTTTLPGGRPSVPYGQTVAAGGGTGVGYTWTVSAGALPTGISLVQGTPNASLQGTPSATGSFSFSLQVTDSAGRTDVQAYTLRVTDLEIQQAVVPPGDVSVAYNFTFSPTGGSGAGYGFTVSAGALPTGITLTPAGLLAGTTTEIGGAYFAVTLTDSASNTVTREYLLTIRAAQRYFAYVGDGTTDNLQELYLVDVSTASPGTPFRPLSSPQPLGDASNIPAACKLSPDGRYLAFMGDLTTDNSDDLYAVDLTAGTPSAVNLTNLTGGRDVEQFEWSPDGKKLAVVADFNTAAQDEMGIFDLSAGVGAAVFTLAQANVTGGDVQPTFTTNQNDDFAWSLDSRKVYFRGDVLVDNRIEAFMFDLGNPGAGAQRLHAPAAATAFVGSVAAAGADVALFVSDLEVDNQSHLYAVSTAGGAIGSPVRLSPNSNAAGDVQTSPFDTRAAPGGRFVAFVGDLTTDNSDDVYLADLRAGIPLAGSASNLSNLGAATFDVGFDALYWSPQGDKLVYVADATLDLVEEAFFVDLRGATPATRVRISPPVTTFEDVDEVRWAPDGSGVTLEGEFNTNGIEELFYVNLAGATPGAVIQLSNPGTASSDVEGDVVWLPDSSAVIFRHDQARSGLNEVFSATPPTVSGAVRIHTAYASDSGSNTVGVGGTNDIFVTRDSQRVIAVSADVFVDNQSEVFLVNLPTLPNLTRVNAVPPMGGDIFSGALQPLDIR